MKKIIGKVSLYIPSLKEIELCVFSLYLEHGNIIMEETSDSCVKLLTNAKWNKICIETIGLGPNDPKIMNAHPMNDVWKDFFKYIDR